MNRNNSLQQRIGSPPESPPPRLIKQHQNSLGGLHSNVRKRSTITTVKSHKSKVAAIGANNLYNDPSDAASPTGNFNLLKSKSKTRIGGKKRSVHSSASFQNNELKLMAQSQPEQSYQVQSQKQEKRIPVKSFRNETNRSVESKIGSGHSQYGNEINLVEHPYREKKI